MNHRSTASFGKRQEYIAVGELLRRGFDIYLTLVTHQQIDYMLRKARPHLVVDHPTARSDRKGEPKQERSERQQILDQILQPNQGRS
jgi:hypothetical protein